MCDIGSGPSGLSPKSRHVSTALRPIARPKASPHSASRPLFLQSQPGVQHQHSSKNQVQHTSVDEFVTARPKGSLFMRTLRRRSW